MDDTTLNRLAGALALVAVLASVASAAPLGIQLASLVAVGGFASLVAAIHLTRPAPIAPDEEERAGTVGFLVGVAASVATIGVLLLLIAATMARVANVTYLGSAALFLAEHFTVVTGPFLAVLGLGTLLAATGRIHVGDDASVVRRGTSLGVLALFTLLALLSAIGLGAFEPWQAPYILSLAGLLAWLDAIQLAGLPTFGEVGAWLERGESEHARALMRNLAVTGNAAVLVAALAGTVLFVLGRSAPALAAELLAAVLLTVSTHAASRLRKALPEELEEDLEDAKSHKEKLRMLGLAPLLLGFIALVATIAALYALAAADATVRDALALALPGMGGALALLAGVNLARSRLRSYHEHGPVRRAISTITLSVLAASAFFALLVELGVMSGPITENGVGLVFSYAAVFAASMFVLARGLYPIPGLEALMARPEADDGERPRESKSELERSLLFVYIASGLFVVGAIGLLSFAMLGDFQLSFAETAEGRNAAFLGLLGLGMLLIVGLAVVFFRSRQLDTIPDEEVTFEKRYTPEEVMRLTVLGFSGTIAFVLVFMGVLVLGGQLESLGSLQLEPKHSTDFFVFGILIGIGPAGYLYNRERKRINAIDARLPEFLRDLAESQRTGMTLTQAVVTASKGNYGALTPEIRKMAAQIEWGISFEDALRSFAERVDTPLVNRTVTLVIEASTSGGDVMDVLMAASSDAREIQMIDADRKGGMQIYVMIIYIAFFVFLGVIAILNVKFMPEVSKAVAGASGVSIGSVTFQEFDIDTFRTLFFHASVIQGLGGGFVAGAMEEGKPVAGLRHAFVMTIIAYVLFRFVLGG